MRLKGLRLCPLAAVNGRVIVKKIVEPQKEGILILPEQNKNEPYKAKVVSAICWSPYSNKDTVLVPHYAGVKVNYNDGNEYIILKEDEILCKIRR